MFEEAAIRYKGSVQLAVVDHISSPSATLFPIKKIADRLRPLGVLVLVDGAHAPGQGMELIDVMRVGEPRQRFTLTTCVPVYSNLCILLLQLSLLT